jgi:glycosyltransferase involved in cell wall biosynthesis
MNTIVNFISKLHGHSRFIFVDVFLEMLLKLAFKIRFFGDIEKFRNEYVLSYKSFSATKPFIKDPERFLKNMAIIQASPKDGGKGILTIAYNYAIPSFMYLFDYEKIMERYHLVLEPSTARFLMPEILICDELKHPVYVQAGEPRDAQFLTRFSKSLIPIPIAANWWLNTNIFNDEVKISKDIDILMVSSFNKLKRHKVLFKALKKLKNKDIKLNVVLIGYVGGELTKIDLEKMACDAGIQDQITVIENIGPEEVAQYYRRSKINVLLSKREGSSRIIIEGMHCGVPILLREGFNFGYKYPFITKESGMYFKDDTLDESIVTLLNKVDEGSINTNKVINNLGINPVHACEIMKKSIYGDNTIMKVHPKASGLHGMEYLKDTDENIFQEEYLFLSSCFISK